MFAEDVGENRVGEEATVAGEVRESVKGVFYDRIGYWLKVKDKTGEAWVFSERKFNKNRRVAATGRIEMNYDQPSLIAQEIRGQGGRGRGNRAQTPIILITLIIAVILLTKFRPDIFGVWLP